MNDTTIQHEFLGVITCKHLYPFATCAIERVFDQVHQNLFKALLVSTRFLRQKVVLLQIDIVPRILITAKTDLRSLKLSLASKVFHDEIKDKPRVEVFSIDFKFPKGQHL